MKEALPSDNDDQKLMREERQVKKLRKVSSIRINDGHTIFEFEIATCILRKATLESISFDSHKKTAHIKQGHIYVCALNSKNAAKKLFKKHRIIKVTYEC